MFQPVERKARYYICVERDKYRLPLCVAESIEELAEMRGVNVSTVYRGIKLYRKQKKNKQKITSTYEEVEK